MQDGHPQHDSILWLALPVYKDVIQPVKSFIEPGHGSSRMRDRSQYAPQYGPHRMTSLTRVQAQVYERLLAIPPNASTYRVPSQSALHVNGLRSEATIDGFPPSQRAGPVLMEYQLKQGTTYFRMQQCHIAIQNAFENSALRTD